MPFAVEIFFAESAERRVRNLWSALEKAQIPSRVKTGGFRPHLTLAVFDGHTEDFPARLKQFAQNLPPLTLCFPSVGIFPQPEGVVFFGAVLSAELSSVHEAFHQEFAGSLHGSREYYRPGQWIPHCTLAIGLTPEEIPGAVRVFASEPLPLTAQAQKIGLVEFPVHREVATFLVNGVEVGNSAQE